MKFGYNHLNLLNIFFLSLQIFYQYCAFTLFIRYLHVLLLLGLSSHICDLGGGGKASKQTKNWPRILEV